MKIAELWTKKIIGGNKTYAEVPTQLKEEVAMMLEEKDYTDFTKAEKATLKKS